MVSRDKVRKYVAAWRKEHPAGSEVELRAALTAWFLGEADYLVGAGESGGGPPEAEAIGCLAGLLLTFWHSLFAPSRNTVRCWIDEEIRAAFRPVG